MQGETSSFSRDSDLLKFNYEKLHQSTLENHRYSWTVSQIFIPLLFTGLGLVVKEYSTFPDRKLEIILSVILIESFALIWWSIMQMFHRYNEVRINRLRQIERALCQEKTEETIVPLEQYSLHYTPRLGISFNSLYHFVLLEVTAINIGLIYLAYQ